MADSDRVSSRRGVVLWEHGPVCCTCLKLAPDRIEMALVVKSVVVEKKVFMNDDAAAEYALAKMHAYRLL